MKRQEKRIKGNDDSRTKTNNMISASLAVLFLIVLIVGVGYEVRGGSSANKAPNASIGYQIVKMNVTANGWQPNVFVIKKGVPVKWMINGLQITGCNKQIVVPAYGLKIDVKPGVQTVEFTPSDATTVHFSCWMGMIQGVFDVRDNVTVGTQSVPSVPEGTCNMNSCGGSCGCGG